MVSSQFRQAAFHVILTSYLLYSLSAQARVTGPCVNCHTMHNSQDNQAITTDGKPLAALLTVDCIGCHTGINTGQNATPYVFDTTPPLYRQTGTEPDANVLAGGNFYWMANSGTIIADRLGHNVYGLSAPDATLTLPPGSNGSFSGQLRCAGVKGCHGRRTENNQIADMKGSHHNSRENTWNSGQTLADSYRFLMGVQGMGDEQFEFHPTNQRHNKYYGQDRSAESQQPAGTISSFCASCHQYFHNGSGSLAPSATFGTGVWLRHPTDFDMSGAASSTEYSQYNGGNGSSNIYSVISPVATEDTTSTINDVVYAKQNDAIVMCLSCHRAHGTPYPALLRWDFKSWPGGGVNGCAVCHTTKN